MTDSSAFLLSSVTDLRAVASALRSGRLGPPFPQVALQWLVEASHGGPLAETLNRWTARGFTPLQMANVLELVVEDRGARSGEAVLDLVTTGPESTAVTSRDTAVVVRDLFRSATRSVLVAGFAVYQGRTVFQSLAERMEHVPQLRVRFFLDIRREQGDPTDEVDLVRRFAQDFWSTQWPESAPRPAVYHFPAALESGPKRAYLHAKCVVIDEERVFITSANFTEAAQERNIEVGVVFRDNSVGEQLSRHFESLATSGLLVRMAN